MLWLWRRPLAIAPVQTLAWETLYATGAALKKKKISKLQSLIKEREVCTNRPEKNLGDT